jgi:tetratricopeptide (TPR) repeat protein
MSPDRWAQVRTIFESALDETPDARAAFVSSACEGDEELHHEVVALLASYDAAPDFLANALPLADALRVSGKTADVLQGTSVGPWRLLRRLGSGGMGVVYLARREDHEFQKIAAIKIVKPGMDSQEILTRFRNERQVLAGLEHPNIARLMDGGTTASGIPYLVMEYVDGLRIDDYCDSHKLSVSERLKLFRTVCSAVSYAHQNLVVHRDLKPSNIFVTEDGVPKLLDFGIAKLLRAEYAGDVLAITRATVHPLTPEYASPEQLRGEPITTATDVYSLGVLLYELLTGQLPYRVERDTVAKMERAICEWEPDPPSVVVTRSTQPITAEESREKLARRLRGDLDVITLTALRKEPQRRYPSVERLSNDLALHLSGAPVTARPDTLTYRAQKFLGRHRAGAAVAGVIALALIVIAGTAVYFASIAEQHKEMTVRLASFVLGDFDTAMQSGVTSARRAAIESVLTSLQELSPSAKDPALRELVFRAYIRAGDLQGNVYESNLGDAGAAKQSYERALALAEAAGSPTGIAEATGKLGDIAFQAGDRKAALGRYTTARRQYEDLVARRSGDRALALSLVRLWYKTGLAQLQLGDVPQAQDSYRRELRLSETLVAEPGAGLDERRELAKAEEHLGGLLLDIHEISEAQQHVRRAVAIYSELLAASPTSFTARSDWAMSCELAADASLAQGNLVDAENNYQESVQVLERLLHDDPNEQYHLWLSQIRSDYSEVLVQRKKLKAARQVTLAVLDDLAQTAERSDPPELLLHQYAWTLLTTPFKDLHDPRAALAAAQRANALTNETDPRVLHVLALAWDENAQPAKAAELERRAMALLPAGTSQKRIQIEQALARFERKANTSQQTPKKDSQAH